MSRWPRSCSTQISVLEGEGYANRPRFYTFPKYIEDTTFGISCDAFANMKVLSLRSQHRLTGAGDTHETQAHGRSVSGPQL